MQRGDHRARADRGIRQRLEGQQRGEAVEPPALLQPAQARLHLDRQLMRLARGIHRKGIVFEGVEFRQHGKPGRPREGRQQSRQPREPGKTRKGCHPNHGGQQYKLVRQANGSVLGGFKGMAQRKRPTIRIPHQMQRQPGRAAARFAHGKARGRSPIRPDHLGQARRHGAMARHARRDGNEASISIKRRQMAHIEGRIREPMHQHHSAAQRALGFQHVGTVPILRESRRMDRACRVITIGGATIFGRQMVGDLLPDEIKGARFGGHKARPIRGIQRRRVQFGRHLGMPDAQIRSMIDIPGAQCDQQHEQRRHQQQRPLAEAFDPTHQHPAPPKDRK